MAKASTKRAKKKTVIVPYDVAEHLRTPEEMAAYLDAWLDEAPEDAAGIARALGDIARAKGMAQVTLRWSAAVTIKCALRGRVLRALS
jgi:DNA-binding phage protein